MMRKDLGDNINFLLLIYQTVIYTRFQKCLFLILFRILLEWIFVFAVFFCHVASLVAQMVKRLPAMRETWVRSLRWEGPLEKEMAT